MSYWEITPYHNNDTDSCVLPAETEKDHRAALEYAQDRLEQLWDESANDIDTEINVSMKLCDGNIEDAINE